MAAALFDIKKVQAEAESELTEEKVKDAKSKIKASLAKIANARAVLANLEREHQVLLETIVAA